MATDWTDLPYDEALAFLRGLYPMGNDDFTALELEVADLAFVVARVTKINMLQWVLDKAAAIFQTGGTVDDFNAQLDDILREAITEAHVEAMARINTQHQFGAGTWQQGSEPGTESRIWGWQYGTLRDDRVRHTHALLDGKRFQTDDPAGRAVFPPWDWGCRCGALWIQRSEIPADAESDALPADVRQDVGDSTYASPALLTQFKPDLTGIDPRIIAAYIDDRPEVN